MKKDVLVSLDEYQLTEIQKSWLEKTYPLGEPIDDAEVVKALGNKLPGDFSSYEYLGAFWSNNQLSIFGRYKVNPDDELLLAMHDILTAVRDNFLDQPERKQVTATELIQVTQRSMVMQFFSV